MVKELIKTREELEAIANALATEIAYPEENIVSRYIKFSYNKVSYLNGKRFENTGCDTNFNLECMDRGLYYYTGLDDFFPDRNFRELKVASELSPNRFTLAKKPVSLPTEQEVIIEDVPSGVDLYDAELAEFTKTHPNTRTYRTFGVEQRVVVNSRGGVAIQSIPLFNIGYSQGYAPIPTVRDLIAVCTSAAEIRDFSKLIQFIADPTLDKKIQKAASFSEAFHQLYSLSKLRYGDLEEAGIPLAGLYDVVVLTGVPAHEVFGHHFEEPIRFLDFGETATFKAGQEVGNNKIVIQDNPDQRIAGFRPQGFTYFDAYGRRRQKRTHVKDGKCIEFLGSEYVDPEMIKAYLNVEKEDFVGNASQHTDGHFPQARMSCTVLDGETEDIDLEGKILIVSHQGHTSSHDKTYVVEANECYVIRNGEPRKVVPLRMTGGINQALKNVMLLNDWNYNPGFCGKPAPQTKGQACVPVSQFARCQVWREQQLYPLSVSKDHLDILRA